MRRKPSKRRNFGEMTLQITSMADIFTIILVFLLKSSATSAVNITPVNGMKIPVGETLNAPVEALKIEVSENSIQIESKPIVELKDFLLPPSEIQPNFVSRSVSQALEIERKRQKLISEQNTSVKADSRILIIADQRVPYITIKAVLASAAVNGYTDYKLVAVNKNQ